MPLKLEIESGHAIAVAFYGQQTGTVNSDMSKNRKHDFRFKYLNNIKVLFEFTLSVT